MSPGPDTTAPPIVQAFDTAFRYLRWLALLLAVLYLAAGITVVQPEEEAIVLRLGRVHRRQAKGGLLLAWPFPIDEVVRVKAREAKRLEVRDLWHPLPGTSRTGEVSDPLSPDYILTDEYIPETIDPAREGYCITGDKDVLQVQVAVKYEISDSVDYALGQAAPEALLKNAILAAVTCSIGEMRVDDALQFRQVLAERIRQRAQQRLDEDRTETESRKKVTSGISVKSVELIQLHPPRHVLKEFIEVRVAKNDAENEKSEAVKEQVARLYEAKGQAVTIVSDAEREALERRQVALGRAQAFRDLLAQYRKSPTVVASRLYRETVEEILRVAPVHGVTVTPGGHVTLIVDFPRPEPKEEDKP